METSENQELEEMAIDSKYRKILIAAKRSKQLQRGAKPRVNVPNAKPTRVALEEVEQGLIDFEVTEKPE
jgi:DNA-directed RNA polymerase subunit omega